MTYFVVHMVHAKSGKLIEQVLPAVDADDARRYCERSYGSGWTVEGVDRYYGRTA